MTCSRLHRDGLLLQGDDVGGDLRPVAVGLVPLQKEAGRRGRTRVRGGREVQQGEGGDRVRIRRRGAESHLLAVGTGAGLIHCLLTDTRRQRRVRRMEGSGEETKVEKRGKVRDENDQEQNMMTTATQRCILLYLEHVRTGELKTLIEKKRSHSFQEHPGWTLKALTIFFICALKSASKTGTLRLLNVTGEKKTKQTGHEHTTDRFNEPPRT